MWVQTFLRLRVWVRRRGRLLLPSPGLLRLLMKVKRVRWRVGWRERFLKLCRFSDSKSEGMKGLREVQIEEVASRLAHAGGGA